DSSDSLRILLGQNSGQLPAVHDVFEENSSAYVAGYIAKWALKQFPLCLLCKSLLVSNKTLDT
ncbi:hypothetical protein X975_10199, partial [Stegodyphus mimosarum]